MKLLQLTGYTDGNSIDCFVTWPINGTPTFTFGATDHVVAGTVALSSRQENTWVYLLMGSSGGNSYGYAIFRQNSDNLFSVTWTEAVVVTKATSIMVPVNANPFNVSSN